MPPIPVATGKIARTVYSSLKEALKSRPNLVPLAEYSGVPRFSKSTISKIDDSVAQVKEIERSIGDLLAVTLDGNTPAGATKLLKERNLSFVVWQLGGGMEFNKGRDTDALKKMVIELNVDDVFFWLGIRNDVAELLDKVDIYVQPSRREAISLTVAEARMHGQKTAHSAGSGWYRFYPSLGGICNQDRSESR